MQWLCLAVDSVLLAWFVSTCLFSLKGYCKSIQNGFELITFNLPESETHQARQETAVGCQTLSFSSGNAQNLQ